ncbi:MAG: heme A synthase [Flavobacteriaceae bacterium]|nr:heme A synthase [Flavobacteriaceae bacterium]|tara:strand:- start:739 stop:1761 length:1023 start_codon:yes stop_codon:yes gene_type:complete
MNKRFIFFLKASLVSIYLVIVAGATVRVTGSGMGCPDWPKCFGYLIPPTERTQLEWKSNNLYNKNEVIIVNESLRVAKKNFKSNNNYNENNWDPYLKHDYSEFNVYHTWIEFLNRLLGAISGIFILIMFCFSFFSWKENKSIVGLSFLSLIGILFQAILGKEVVDSNLLPLKITIHLIMAFVILGILTFTLFISRKNPIRFKVNNKILIILSFGFFLTLIQIFSGTQVRQFIDNQMNEFPEKHELWLKFAPIKFYFHRSFSLIILLTHFLLFYEFKKIKIIPFPLKIILLVLFLEIITGALMYYLDFPISSQPIHLLLATFIFSSQLYLLLQVTSKSKIL